MLNRLANEQSPYLQQHANNPVDWYPWCEEAFNRSQQEQKPIFLSIGYSTCHWCHVMEHESFAHQKIASVLNEHFVSVKVDREERPDVDRVYMAFVQATTGSGGWPMSVWLTPALKPFFGGTYFPPDSRWGRPGFPDILNEIASRWETNREELEQSAEAIMERLRETKVTALSGSGSSESTRSTPTVDALSVAVEQYAQAFDTRYGGFGDAPKFPRPAELLFLLRESARSGESTPCRIAVTTLEAMASGGMRDHIGGGFHRYSVDAAWRVPHFEKMLYDQAQLIMAYLEGGLAVQGKGLLVVAEDTVDYVLREMTHPEGGFFSAEDADSLVPDESADSRTKSEGAFYLWSAAEIDSVLGGTADVLKRRLGIEPDGNAPQDPMGEFRGKNIPYLQQDVDEIARLTGQSADAVVLTLGDARKRLFDVRALRSRPDRDEKILAAWNGLMIASLSRAGHVFAAQQGQRCTAAAVAAASFVREHLWDDDAGMLARRYRNGAVSSSGYAEDYACVIWGALELFQTTGEIEWFDWATRLQERQDELFWDDKDGGWFATTGGDPSILLRVKEDYDGAEPSAGSVAVDNLMTLWHLTGNEAYLVKVERVLSRFGNRLGQLARVVPMMMAALVRYHAIPTQVVLVGLRGAADLKALERVVADHYLPFSVRVIVTPGEQQEELARRLPYVKAMSMVAGVATAYVCTKFSCREPVTDPKLLNEQLRQIKQSNGASLV